MSQAQKSTTETLVDFLQDVEQESRDIWSLRAVRLEDGSGGLRGLCLLDPNLGEERLNLLHSKLTDLGQLLSASEGGAAESATSQSGNESGLAVSCPFKSDLEAAYQNAVTSRLPLSLLLIECMRSFESSDLPARICQLLGQESILHPYQSPAQKQRGTTWAMIMPSQGLGKARSAARRLLDSLNSDKERIKGVGLAIIFGGSNQNSDDLIRLAEENLIKGRSRSDCLGFGGGSSREDSCQVTAEERACLFGIKS